MKKSLLTAAILSTLSFGAMAETPSFNFFEIGKTQLDVDGTSAEPDGYEFKWNYEFNDNVYLNLDYSKVDESNAELKMTNAGVGYKSEISNSSVVFVQLDWAKLENNAGFDEDGYRLGLGVRTNLTKNFEVKAVYERLDVDSDESDLYTLGGAYNFTDTLAVYADYTKESDFDQTSIGVRWSF
ncbi:porin [Aliikangiella coralliicola]|uniref:Porin n=1 Tax=Aliikangiella coralliicola TaxID=2592383 RepID=A0A545UJX2_9GAMM|nr:porin [Aliikangiella coralliicola]TQV89770.1 porin [Aliikangiella coralliicola]